MTEPAVANVITQKAEIISYISDAFGTASVYGGSFNPFTYNGEYTDGHTGLQYLRARYYNSAAEALLPRIPMPAVS